MTRIDNTNQLQGWRQATEEELKVIQGIFLKEAKQEKGLDSVANIFFGLFGGLSLMGSCSIFNFITQSFRENEIMDTLILAIMMIASFLFGIVLIKELVNSKNTANKFFDAINTNKLKVNDVEIVEVISLRGVGNGTDGHRVKVKDMFDNYCDENIVFECKNGYKKTKAILIDIPISENENGIVSRTRVIPCKEYDERLWNIGLFNYNRNSNR